MWGETWERRWSRLSGAGANLEPLQLQAGAPVEGQCVAPVSAQLGHHMEALVLQLVIECADAEVLQGVGCKRLPCRKGPWAQQLPSPVGLCRQDAGAEERGGLPAGEAGSAEELTRAGGSSREGTLQGSARPPSAAPDPHSEDPELWPLSNLTT